MGNARGERACVTHGERKGRESLRDAWGTGDEAGFL